MMKAGFFATDITPPTGTMQAGNYSPQFINGVAGAVKIRASMFEKGDQHVLFAVVDCCSLSKTFINKALSHYAKTDGPKIDSYIISATHTHSGPAISTFLQSDLVDKLAPEAVALTKDSAVPDDWFVEYAARQLATAIQMAAHRMEPAVISVGKGQESGFAFNRRLVCKDGRAYSHPGKMNPDIVDFANPIDPMVGVLGAWREDGSLIGAMVNFCCHGTCYSGHLAHGDWIPYVEETLQKHFGPNTGVVILNGPCGDVTQVNNLSRARDFGLDIAERLGVRIGAEALKVLVSTPKQDDPTLAFKDTVLPIPRRVPDQELLKKAWEIVRSGEDPRHTEPVFARERILASELQRVQPIKDVPLTAIQIGSALFLSVPAEYFTSLSLRIKASTPFDVTMITELANDCIGYVADKAAFDPKTGGGYETCLTAYSCLVPDAGDRIADALIDMSRAFTPDTVPVDESMPQGSYWTYGSRGPDLK